MPPIIVNLADCEVRAVIRFLSAKGLKPIGIHREICAVYGQNIISDGMVRKWVREFKDAVTNVHDEQRSGRPSVVNESLVQKVDNKVRENRRFTISSSCDDFHNVSRSVLYDIVTEHLSYRNLCSRWVPKMLTDVHKTKRLGSDDFLSKIVTGDKAWVTYFTPESKQ